MGRNSSNQSVTGSVKVKARQKIRALPFFYVRAFSIPAYPG
ncbi:MAG: hypothetical protein ACLFR0_08640 [Alphaproteobacteria bacterium]